MANRKTSVLLQIGTAAAMAGAWLLARKLRKNDDCPHSDGPYCIDPKHYGILSVALLLADLWAIPAVLRGKLDISVEEALGLDHGLVPWIDRHALSFAGERSDHYRKASDRVLQVLIAAPAALMLNVRMRKDWPRLAALYVWVHALGYTVYSFSPLGPAFVDKYRPVVYYKDLPEAIRMLGNNRNARFSGHTANGACAAFFLAKVYNDYHPKSSVPEKALRYLLAFGAPLLLGWLRMKSLKHFPTDVLEAIAIGGACGVMVPELYRRKG